MPAQQPPSMPWSEAQFYEAREAAPFGERWELVDGEVLVTPSPDWVHQHVAGGLFERLAPYVRTHRLGATFTAPLDVRLEPGLVLQPDLLVVPGVELRRRGDIVSRLLLAVEVVSPASARHDRVVKRPWYQRARVAEYWVVDDLSRTVERWQSGDERPALVADRLSWLPAGASTPWELDLSSFFREVLPADE